MLRDLRFPGKGTSITSVNSVNSVKDVTMKVGQEKKLLVVYGIIDDVFQEINDSIQHDRSKVKLNMFEKGFIGGMLNDKVKEGIKKYMFNMDERDVESMINKIKNRVKDI